jgi:leucyl aminopeptidase
LADAYKTKKKKDESEDDGATRVTIAVADVAAAEAAAAARAAIADGVITARTLVNEPPNVLYPESFAERVKQLESVGLEVEVLDVPAMEKLGMGAILGVSQGSARPGRIVVMRWNGFSAAWPARQRRSRSPSSARASPSTRAASRSSRRRAWRT